MTALLTWATLAVTAAVVIVLAAYLIGIALALRRANHHLARLVEGLEAVRDHTAPLDADISAINEAAVALRERLIAVDRHLLRIGER